MQRPPARARRRDLNSRPPPPPSPALLPDFRTLSIFPSAADLKDTRPYVRANVVKGAYDDVEHYLDVQFRLLREDVFKPLRDGVQAYRKQIEHGLPVEALRDIKVYAGVVVIGAVVTQWSVNYKIRFDTTKNKNVRRLMDSKRLIFGSQVVLSHDNFDTIYVATVQEKNSDSAAHGELEIKFEAKSAEKIQAIDYSMIDFVMVETSAYFEAYRHVLEGLQDLNTKDLKFQEYLVRCDSTCRFAPSYLKRDTVYDLSCIAPRSTKPAVLQRLRCVPILRENQWPVPGDLGLDESQAEAVKTALTRELAIIQGPPGTGKTYIGLKIVQALLANPPQNSLAEVLARWEPFSSAKSTSNSGVESSPILVVCYTNHALDQFLEGIVDYARDGVIRIGSRSTSTKLQKCLLSKQEDRHRLIPAEQRKKFGQYRKLVESICKKTASYSHRAVLSDRGVLKLAVLKPFMQRIHMHHIEKLKYDRMGKLAKLDPLVEWLNLPEAFGPAGVIAGAGLEVSFEESSSVIGEERRLELQQRLLDGYDDDKFRREADAVRWMEQLELQDMAINFFALAKGSAMHLEQDYGRLSELVKKRSNAKRLLLRLRSTRPMQPDQELSLTTPGSMTLDSRWSLYMTWVCRYRKHLTDQVMAACRDHADLVSQLRQLRIDGDVAVLKKAKVIGMTTTGAARNRHVLKLIKPHIVVVEEAAEVLEAHLIATLNSGCEHLILIGDHKQLRPNPTVHELAKKYHLDISLFERMVNNDLPYATLATQRRMRPEISSIMKNHFYSHLRDHPSVQAYDSVSGVTASMFYVEHEEPEQYDGDIASYSNLHEAKFVVALSAYLLKRGYTASQITILTPYNGQLNLICKLTEDVSKEFRITSIDGYQGEENDIVLFSIVRSNNEDILGFTNVANRICVALSRARQGFYAFGNFNMLSRRSELWRNIVADVKKKGALGKKLELICRDHKRITAVASAEDFRNVPRGGCSRPCKRLLKCGHQCPLECHVSGHDEVRCASTVKCRRVHRDCGHECTMRCCDPCPELCTKRIKKECGMCGYGNVMECHEVIDAFCTKCGNCLDLDDLSSENSVNSADSDCDSYGYDLASDD